jgi:PAS domain S-box-containing protein
MPDPSVIEAVLDAIPDVIGIQDLEHRVLRYNAAGYAYFGLRPEQVHGRRCYELMGWRAPCTHCATTRAIKSRVSEQIEKYVPELQRWLEIRAYPVLDEHGEVVRVIEHLRDISSRKLAEQALRESEARYSQVTTQTNDAIVVIQDDAFVFVNPAWERLTGYSAEEFMALPFGATLAPDDRERVIARYRARVAGDTPPPVYEIRLMHKDGHELEVELSAARVEWHGRPADLAVVRDISERKQAERARRELEDRVHQAQKLESLGVLAGGIAHDFNNLLVGVLGNASLLHADLPESSPLYQPVLEIEVAARRASELVRQMLAYAGKGLAVERSLDLGATVAEIVELLKASIDKRAVLRLELARDLPQVRADPSQIRQVVMNLLVNASDALEGEPGVVEVCTAEKERTGAAGEARAWASDPLPAGRYCSLQVSDTGVGIAPELLGRIFDPFFTTKATGRGLGLSAILGIMRRHRGAIEVQSRPGRTVFEVLFPIAAVDPAAAEDEEDAAPCWRGAGLVLLADDEPAVLAVGTRLLERLGFEVEQAADGGAALERFAAGPERFALVVLDLSMPVMDGRRCLGELHRIRPEGPVLLSSGYPEDEQELRRAGFSGFVHKPYRLGSLAAQLALVLGGAGDGER